MHAPVETPETEKPVTTGFLTIRNPIENFSVLLEGITTVCALTRMRIRFLRL